jgi:hypothetical protein
MTKYNKRPLRRRPMVQARDVLTRLVVVMIPPCPSPPLLARAMRTFRFFKVFLGLLRVVDYYKLGTAKLKLISTYAKPLRNRS